MIMNLNLSKIYSMSIYYTYDVDFIQKQDYENVNRSKKYSKGRVVE